MFFFSNIYVYLLTQIPVNISIEKSKCSFDRLLSTTLSVRVLFDT